jgi:hypothetical protein
MQATETIVATTPAPVEPTLDTADDRVRARAVRFQVPWLGAGQALFIAVSLFALFRGWQRELRFPLAFSSDTLWFLMQSKSTVDNGWWWSNPRLGAPFGLEVLAYPSNSNVDQAIVWAVSRVVTNAIASVNLAWAIMVVLSGVSATWCLRKLDVSAPNALVAGTLFALSPYALYRNIDHFSLVIYLVPFGCTVALWLASGQSLQAWPDKARHVVLGGCALLAFNYVYYAFFASFCILVGTLVGFFASRTPRVLAAGALSIAIVSTGTLVNLAPSFLSWARHGRPLVVRDKVPAEAEVFGLKIRQLISPVFPNRFSPFRKWVETEAAARFPNDNENWTSRLGLVGTIGFLALVLWLFVPDVARPHIPPLFGAASRLTLAALLLATVGGFGTIFNLLVSSDIRAYNRIFPFIHFFSLLAIALASDSLFKSRARRVIAATAVLSLGLADQGQAARAFTTRYPKIVAEISSLETFVGQLERALPADAIVFQLPIRSFMNEGDFGDMKSYDHLKPYLVSHSLRFSYPALSNEQARWQEAMARLDVGSLTTHLRAEGFSATLVDRYGYEDYGAAVVAALSRTVGANRVVARSDRYIAFDIRSPGEAPEPPAADTSELLPATLSLAACKGQPRAIIDQIGGAHAPFGGNVPISRSSELKVSGWAVDAPNRMPAAGVDVVVDRTPFASMYGANRNDVAEYFQQPVYRESGFTAGIPANRLERGEHGISLRVVSADRRCYYQSSVVTITVE